jgi:aminoglycoside phosphotransferase (APT) family kinase protein
MSHEGTRSERDSWKQRCEATFSERDFVRGKVEPLIPELAGNGHRGGTATFVRAKATGRMTLRYEFAETAAVYAKAYYSNRLGLEAYEWLRKLWGDGFGSQSYYRVPQPLGYIAEESMLVMREVRGAAVSELAVKGTREQAAEAMRVAARWLVRLHRSHLDGLDIEPACEQIEVLTTAALLAKVAAQFPERAPSLIDMVHQLRELAPSGSSSVKLTALHGEYRPAHVFIEGDSVSVIDLDRIRLSDPAKDVSRFVHVLKKTCYEGGAGAVHACLLAREFVEEYRMGAPENLAHLAYFDALYSLKAFAKVVKITEAEEQAPEAPEAAEAIGAMERLYLDDFALATQQLTSSKMAQKIH